MRFFLDLIKKNPVNKIVANFDVFLTLYTIYHMVYHLKLQSTQMMSKRTTRTYRMKIGSKLHGLYLCGPISRANAEFIQIKYIPLRVRGGEESRSFTIFSKSV